jgi:hypothetical protein
MQQCGPYVVTGGGEPGRRSQVYRTLHPELKVDSATTLMGPEGECLAFVPYGQEQLLVHDLDLSRATGLCAKRYKPAFYPA